MATIHTIYQPTNFLPSIYNADGGCIDMTKDNIFSCTVNGGVVDSYELFIKDLNNTAVYDSTKRTLSPTLHNNQTLSVNVSGGTVTTKGALKWSIIYYNGTESITSYDYVFINMTTPTLSQSVGSSVTSANITNIGTYSQAENIQVKDYNLSLYSENYDVDCGNAGDTVNGTTIDCGNAGDTVNGIIINCGDI